MNVAFIYVNMNDKSKKVATLIINIDKVKHYAISRSDEKFWDYYDWFQERFEKDDPMNVGLYDLNRYYRKPWGKQ